MGRVMGVLRGKVGEICDGESDWRFVVPGGTWSTVS